MRWMTTLRKLPTHKPSTARPQGVSTMSVRTGSKLSNMKAVSLNAGWHACSDDLTELEDGQVHGYHDAPNDRAQDHDDEGLHQAGQRLHGLVNFFFVEVGGLAQHLVQRAGLLAD